MLDLQERQKHNIYENDLADANSTCYLKIHEEFIKLGATISNMEHGIFYLKEKGNLKGLGTYFAYDITRAGNKTFENTINKIKQVFQIGNKYIKSFKYTPININQNFFWTGIHSIQG